MPPRLPPRSLSQASTTSSVDDSPSPGSFSRNDTIHLTPHTIPNHPYSNHNGLSDPRSSSTQSLRPVESAGPNRRTLLIIYIHGFMGAETSFRSFPAHVHSLLTMTMVESHVVHTKIYPRYQSRKNISFARDAFSNWLVPHESETTDIVLVGHSLGGILGAEVILLPSHTPGSHNALQHRILGLIAFDTPFLGMHPGVIGTGIASLFRGAPEIVDQQVEDSGIAGPSDSRQSFDSASTDPNFNPAYPNDVRLPVRSNKWEKAWYFMNKHYGELRKATESYVKSHLEFGGCMADYPGLKKRYDAIRKLEDIDGLQGNISSDGRAVHRVRFVNYYTASTGRIKEQKAQLKDQMLTTETEIQMLKPASNDDLSLHSSQSHTPRLSLEEHHGDDIVDKTEQLQIDHESDSDHDNDEPLQAMDPRPHEDIEIEQPEHEILALEPTATTSTMFDDLPPLPPEPVPPATLDFTQYTDPDALNLAQREKARQTKAYERAMKDHQEAISDRNKVIAKRERQIKKEQEKSIRATKDKEDRLQVEKIHRQATLNPEHEDRQMREDAKEQPSSAHKKKKDRKFCSLPAKDQTGRRDPTWIRVYMENMDEVVAHTSLFFVSDAYARLVGDTAERIEQWVAEDATMRILRDEDNAW